MLVLAAAGCASATGATSPSPAPVPQATSCRDVVASTLGRIATRIYSQAERGMNVATSVRRLDRSRALSAAVAAGDRRATRRALLPLLQHQIKRIVITRGSHVLARAGSAPALAPIHGILRNAQGAPVGRYVMSVGLDTALAGITQTLTGARVVMRAAGRRVAGAAGPATRSIAFTGEAFPRGRIQIALQIPGSALKACGSSTPETIANTVGAVGARLLRAESGGPAAKRVLAHVAHDRRFLRAVATDDPAALRTAIVRFFRTRWMHVVRIRAAMADGRLVNDVGGPYVLSPASQTLRARNGAVIGRVTLSVQDDTGYIKLMHRFTGADVLLRTPAGRVPGSSLVPGPLSIPARGWLTYRGSQYEAYTLTGTAFPSGPLSIALLMHA